MIRIEFDKKSNPNYVMTKWIEETPTSSAMLGRLMIPELMFIEAMPYLEQMGNFKFVEKPSA